MTTMLRAEGLSKQFLLHTQNSVSLPVFAQVDFTVKKGEAVILHGASGVGKSTLLRILYGNYRPSAGHVHVLHGSQFVDIVTATPRRVLEVRRRTLSFVSQFLRVIPRVSTIDIVKDPMLARGIDPSEATRRAGDMLARLNLPERLWTLAPSTFSGGEQQRVNIARSFVDPTAIMLLDEPTASLDAANRDVVVHLIDEARNNGAAIIGIFHDEAVRDRIATRRLDLTAYRAAA
jgi:alpha-D-ribose 1-methylphosphonate 5-triphosphate synthase subunit PhnL